MRKVLTLHPKEFAETCIRLAEEAGAFAPEIIVGVLTGGGEVGRILKERFPDTIYFEVHLHRSGTKRKRNLRPLLRLLPTKVANRLRVFESKRLENRNHSTKSVSLPESLCAYIREHDSARVLIVDDAVDSGHTLLSVVEAVKKLSPTTEIRTAVLTVTTSSPVINPDYALWRDGTLLRFPWSHDYHRRRR